MKNGKLFFLISMFSLLTFPAINAQTCGFGCLGLSGVLGGYSFQRYDASGLNEYLNNPQNLLAMISNSENFQFNFKEARGIKVGMNIIRARYTHAFFTFKGFYQFLDESQSLEIEDNRYTTNVDLKLKMDNWGIGLDFGIPIFSFLDWKIVDGELNFFSPQLTYDVTTNNPNATMPIENGTYTPDDIKMGYSVGSGIMINLIENYVNIEVTGKYSFIEINYLSNDNDGTPIPEAKSVSLISNGGFGGIVQLNVGIPF